MFSTNKIGVLLCLCSVLLTLAACDTRRNPNQEQVREEMASREPKRVSQGELMAKGEAIGKAVVEKTQKTFQAALMKAISEQGISGAVEYCNLNAYALVKNFEDSLKVTITRVTDKPRNPKATLSALEREIFEAYQYAPEHATSHIQELDQESLIYNQPIPISNGACLNCHGKVGTTVAAADYRVIRSLYPQDQAVDYETGDLRGMWSIKIPKKTVVEQL